MGLEPTQSALRERRPSRRASPAFLSSLVTRHSPLLRGWPVGVEPTHLRVTAGSRCRFGFGHIIPGRSRTCITSAFAGRRASATLQGYRSLPRPGLEPETRRSKRRMMSISPPRRKPCLRELRVMESNHPFRVQSPALPPINQPARVVASGEWRVVSEHQIPHSTLNTRHSPLLMWRLGSPIPSRHVSALGGIRTRDLRIERATTTPLVRQGISSN